jgi:hypothetical protein
MDPCWFDNTKLSKLTEYIPVFNKKKLKSVDSVVRPSILNTIIAMDKETV